MHVIVQILGIIFFITISGIVMQEINSTNSIGNITYDENFKNTTSSNKTDEGLGILILKVLTIITIIPAPLQIVTLFYSLYKYYSNDDVGFCDAVIMPQLCFGRTLYHWCRDLYHWCRRRISRRNYENEQTCDVQVRNEHNAQSANDDVV